SSDNQRTACHSYPPQDLMKKGNTENRADKRFQVYEDSCLRSRNPLQSPIPQQRCARGSEGEPIRRRWLPGLIDDCVPLRSSCAMHWVPAQRLNPVYRRLMKMALEDLAIDRGADRPTRPGDGESAARASRCGTTAGRSPRLGSGFGATDHCR